MDVHERGGGGSPRQEQIERLDGMRPVGDVEPAIAALTALRAIRSRIARPAFEYAEVARRSGARVVKRLTACFLNPPVRAHPCAPSRSASRSGAPRSRPR